LHNFVVLATLKAGAATDDVRLNEATKTVQAFVIDGVASNRLKSPLLFTLGSPKGISQ
jgi:hypothetical protein